MNAVSEDDVEQALLQWLAELGWATAHGPDISPPDAKTAGSERATYRDAVIVSTRTSAAVPGWIGTVASCSLSTANVVTS